jgi:hypothetical protein
MLETLRLPDRERKLGDFGFAGDDHVVPFEVGPLDIRCSTPFSEGTSTPIRWRACSPKPAWSRCCSAPR